jgi:pimeloyl-ACP methyl ester carboxylesterase
MRRRALISALVALLLWGLATLVVGSWLLPPLLLAVPTPSRQEADRDALRVKLRQPGDSWERQAIRGGEDRPLDVWRLRRPGSLGVVIYLHGFGDDAWGTLGRAADLPGWDAVGFTFRGRDLDPAAPCTLGGWERKDVAAVVKRIEAEGVPRQRIILAGWSMGAGVALLALEELESDGGPLGGALLECPFEDIRAATRDHLRGTLGRFEILARPAEELALRQVRRLARFEPDSVSPRRAARNLRTPVALVTGDADRETPVAGVRAIAAENADLTIVPGAGHCEASNRLPGGWGAWASERLKRWGFLINSNRR